MLERPRIPLATEPVLPRVPAGPSATGQAGRPLAVVPSRDWPARAVWDLELGES